MFTAVTLTCILQAVPVALLDFTGTDEIAGYDLVIKLTLADGTVMKEFVSIPDKSDAITARAFVWSIIDDWSESGIGVKMLAGNRLVVFGTAKPLKAIEFFAPPATDGTERGMVQLKYKRFPSSDWGPKVYVNGKEASKK